MSIRQVFMGSASGPPPPPPPPPPPTGVAIDDHIVSRGGPGVGTVTAVIDYQANGFTTGIDETEMWKLSGLSSDYDIRCTYQSGSHPTVGVENTWLSLSTDRVWNLQASAGQEKTSVFLIQIRQAAAPQTILDAATITLEALNSNA